VRQHHSGVKQVMRYILVHDIAPHWHPPEAEDRDEEPCPDAACRHIGMRFRHPRPCPPDDIEHEDVPCDYQVLHASNCRCARCDPEYAASVPKWNELTDAYTYEKARERANVNRSGEALSARERFAQMQEQKRAAAAT